MSELTTLYNALSPVPAVELGEQLSSLVEPLGFSATELIEQKEGSFLASVERAGDDPITLALWIMSVEVGTFAPPHFDADWPEEDAQEIVSVCKLGARKVTDPRRAVLAALEVAATLGIGGRVYDLHAELAFAPVEAAELAAQRRFEVSSFLSYHYLTPVGGDAEHSWLHTHGMAKFFSPDFEAFDIHPDVSHRALGLIFAVAHRFAAGEHSTVGEPLPRGRAQVVLRHSATVRDEGEHFPAEDIADHDVDQYLALEDAGRYRSLTLLLRGAYEMEPKSTAQCESEQMVWQRRLAGVRHAWSEAEDGIHVAVRAALVLSEGTSTEHIWVDVESWKGSVLKGKLLNDSYTDQTKHRGTEVAFEASQVSGVAAWRGAEVLDEVSTLRLVDVAAAEALDKALEAPESSGRSERSVAPDGHTAAVFEDDGRAAYVRLERTSDGSSLCPPLWIYNCLATPPLMDERPLDKGMLPLLSEVHVGQRRRREAPPPSAKITMSWDDHRLFLFFDGDPWAIVDLAEGHGWSKLIELPSAYGRPWEEIDEILGTVRAPSLFTPR